MEEQKDNFVLSLGAKTSKCSLETNQTETPTCWSGPIRGGPEVVIVPVLFGLIFLLGMVGNTVLPISSSWTWALQTSPFWSSVSPSRPPSTPCQMDLWCLLLQVGSLLGRGNNAGQHLYFGGYICGPIHCCGPCKAFTLYPQQAQCCPRHGCHLAAVSTHCHPCGPAPGPHEWSSANTQQLLLLGALGKNSQAHVQDYHPAGGIPPARVLITLLLCQGGWQGHQKSLNFKPFLSQE